MDSAMTDLARRAVACDGWRWMAGMRCVSSIPDVHWVGRVYREAPSRLAIVDESCGSTTHCSTPISDRLKLIPDLTDPATIGCIAALVIERISWGRWVIEYDGSIQPGTLVAALEAANV